MRLRRTQPHQPASHQAESDVTHSASRARHQQPARLIGMLHRLPLQAKLTINEPGDVYEQEADRVADTVMRMPAHGVQRACACGGAAGSDDECPACHAHRIELQRQPLEEEEMLQAKHSDGTATSESSAPPIVHRVLQSHGSPLDHAIRSFMEPRLGRDFGDVRVHTDGQANESAQAVNAQAYTVGKNIVFGAGHYAPGSSSGQHLMAHELTHVVQQTQPDIHRPDVQRQTPASSPQMRPGGDILRTSPSTGVPIRNGTLSWRLEYKGLASRSSVGPGGQMTIHLPKDVEMNVTFTPVAGAGGCPTITFIQTVRATTNGMHDSAKVLPTQEQTTGASADVQRGEVEPYYGAQPLTGGAGLGPEPSTQIAGTGTGRSTTATFGDAPVRGSQFIPPGQTALREFEVAVVCVESGQTFGSLRWGYSKTSSGIITLTGAQTSDVRAQSASPQFESIRQAFYTGVFQHTLPAFGRGSRRLTSAHRQTLRQIAGQRRVRQITLVGANDFSGGPENNARLSLRRAEAARDFLVRLGVDRNIIVVQGIGVAARDLNSPGQRVPANRRVDIHLDFGTPHITPGTIGSPTEIRRFRMQDPHDTLEEFVLFLIELQRMRGSIPRTHCNQIIHMMDGLRRWQRVDPTIPDVHRLYGPTVRQIRRRCADRIGRAPIEFHPRPLQPPNFVDQIGPPED